MRMTIILASICVFLVSCATFTGGDTPAEQPAAESAAASPASETPAAPTGDAYAAAPTSPDIGDVGQASMEAQAAEHQTAQVDTMNEQRSSNELDAAAPEGSAAGTDSFYASSQPATPPEVEQVTESAPMPSSLPQKQVASWDKHTDTSSSYQEEKPMTSKKHKKLSKKHDKKKIAKHSKKQKREIAKHSKKSKKAIAKKSKVDCKKVAKHTKKSSKREIAMCKAEIKKIAKHKKGSKTGKVAQAGCQCNYR